jgi:hypothetical protein
MRSSAARSLAPAPPPLSGGCELLLLVLLDTRARPQTVKDADTKSPSRSESIFSTPSKPSMDGVYQALVGLYGK